jgi:hypothetical protein
LRRLVPRVAHEWGVPLSVDTLRRLARRAGYSWKRLRRSLKSRRDAGLFALFQQELAALHQAEARGELAVVYVDECRFSRQAPVPYAWQVRGHPPCALPAERGGGRTVLGLWQAKGPGQPLISYALAGALTADVFAAVLDAYAQTLTGPTVLVLDNASVHHAACVRARQADWAACGLRLQFLPAYCPELNLIELLWHRCKHYWLTPADYHSEQTLVQALERILPAIGQTYTITFA